MNQAHFKELPNRKILIGDAHTRLQELPSHSVDCVIASPPYFRLRNYGVDGQIGLEESVDQWVQALLAVCCEVARVLKPTGVFWLNLGDTYSRSAKHGSAAKSLVLAPEKLLIALEQTGWLIRNKIVWAKPNGMPSSVKDRLSCRWEPLYLLSRSPDYFFDLDAIRVPARSALRQPAKLAGHTKYRLHGSARPSWSGPSAGVNSGLDAMKARGVTAHPLGKNPGDVWTIPTANYKGAHFATFPEGLVRRPMEATCPQRVCLSCGIAWRRAPFTPAARAIGAVAVMGSLRKSCGCEAPAWQAGMVLDPFMGAGTVGVVAEKLNRRWIGIELSEEFAEQARVRIQEDRAEPEA